ncbi:S8 family serine peptidase [Jannaschia formosa]|uniref:S8 family serine peptidase n=1 Tax=Jannaschia formosa TaxID=2259592 RepID=UPI000E1B98CC|nr:S8 family serine peptidase [Jannaschia formosa]TFL16000.1 hypothetical protein DR046_22340 [Jannaschia formosa]
MRFDPKWLEVEGFSWSVGYALASLAQLSYSDARAVRRALETLWRDRLTIFSIGRSQGFVATSDRAVVVAFRGTDQIGDWWDNVNVPSRPSQIVGGGVHGGFLNAYDTVRDTVEMALNAADPGGPKRLWFTGHSLGGALATIAAMHHADRGVTGLVTFGQPRCFDNAARARIAQVLGARYNRMVNDGDVVARIPGNLGHAGRLRLLDEGGPVERDLDGAEAAGDLDAGPPPLPPKEEAILHAQIEAADAMQAEGLFGGEEPGQGAEGLLPGIRMHRMTLYADRMREAADAIDPAFQVESERLTTTRIEARGIDRVGVPRDMPPDLFDGEEAGIERIGSMDETGAGALPASVQKRLNARQPVVILLRSDAWVPPDDVSIDTREGLVVTAQAHPEQIAAIERDRAHVKSIEISRDVETMELHESGEIVAARAVQRPPISERGAHAAVGLVDTGIDVLHRAFRDDQGETRIAAIWDQFDTTGPTPHAVDPAFGPDYGRLYLRNEIQALINGGAAAVPPRLRDPRAHGTHVAGIAAGRAVGTLADGMAPDAAIVLVIPRLSPSTPHEPPSLGYSKTHVDAIYFLKRASQGGTAVMQHPRPMAVNVSLGMMAGPHDGRTPLERAFERVVDDGYAQGFAVIKSAGNAAMEALHAQAKLSGGWQDLSWSRKADASRRRDYFEAWHHGTDRVEFQVIDPLGRETEICSENTSSVRAVLGGNVVRLDLIPTHPHNGDAQLVIAIDADAQPIQEGSWRLRLRAEEIRSRERRLDIWTETRRENPVRFDHPSLEGTLSVPGTADFVVSVGACGSKDGMLLASFSSHGPTRDGRDKPDVCAPGMEVRSASANGLLGDELIPKNGTSMAAPHVTGAVALLYSRLAAAGVPQPTVAEILGDLRRHARSTGGFHPGFGSGILDVRGFLNACCQRHAPHLPAIPLPIA